VEPWYKIVTPRKEVRQGRSFNPDEFAIALEQVVSGKAPDDYKKPDQFFARTCFTRALREHAGMVLRRLAGKTENTAPVLTLITQFGGGKTHTLTTLYHLAKVGKAAAKMTGVQALLDDAGLDKVPKASVAVFVGNAWDPKEGLETPWLDVAYQLAGAKGVAVLGPAAKTKPPGTEALGRLFEAAGGAVLILCDEVLNFINRHRDLAEPFHAFVQNLTVAMTGTSRGSAIISLPRSQVEMTDHDLKWQEKITKVVRRVAKDLIANDEAEISEVIRRRLFEDLGPERTRKSVAKTYADWCFERRAQLPPEWTAVDTATTEKKSRDYLQGRFEACYPFHPATLSVFQRKWQALAQYQQTRGTLAMLAQWISWACKDGFVYARKEPLITLGSAPLEVPDFRSTVLGQLGESRLVAAIDTDVSGEQAHARVLDGDTKAALRDIHRRVGTTILFESSGGQADKVAHLPELRFALGGPEIDTTSIDNAAMAVEAKAFFVRKVGADGFRIGYDPKLTKVVNDRRASLDADEDVMPAMNSIVATEFAQDANVPVVQFPEDSTAVQDSPRLALVLMEPQQEWTGEGELRKQIAEWTKQRGRSPRLYPGSLVWCIRKPGRDLRDKVEMMLAWKRVQREIAEGVLGSEFSQADKIDLRAKVLDAQEAAKDEVWAGYRFVVVADSQEPDGIKSIDLGAGHASGAETLTGRVIAALKSEALLNESVGAGYIDRNWPPALKESGAWPLASLRQSFLNGALTRLLDPDVTLRSKIVEFVGRGDFGLVSGTRLDGTYERIWFEELVPPDEIAFDPGVFLLKKTRAKNLKTAPAAILTLETDTESKTVGETVSGPGTTPAPSEGSKTKTVPTIRTLRLVGSVPPEVWNRLGTKILPKLRSGDDLTINVDFSVKVNGEVSTTLESDLRRIIDDLGLAGRIRIE
jgi:hypothetical protein